MQRAVRALLLLGTLASALAILVSDGRSIGVRLLEEGVRDALMRVSARDERDPRIAVVDIDEHSLQRLGAWPWPRERLADLAERLLSNEGAAQVVFDLVLTEADIRDPVADARLLSMGKARALVLAQAFDYERRDAPARVGVAGGAFSTQGSDRPLSAATGLIGNFSSLAATPCIGNIGVVPDADGKIRRIAPFTRWEGRDYPTLAIAALGCRDADQRVDRLTQHLPTDSHGQWRVRFARVPQSYLAIPAYRILEESEARTREPNALLAGRIVIVGSSALGLSDRVATPLSANVAGVTVHAAALSSLLDLRSNSVMTPPPVWLVFLWTLASILVFSWSVSGIAGRLTRALATLSVIGTFWIALATWSVLGSGTTSISAALVGYGAILLVQLPLEWSWAQARARKRTRLLSRYVAPTVLAELLKSKDEDPLAPRRSSITVLIADMQDYTLNTAHSTLDDAAALTKGFLDELTRPVLEHRGTLDRYTGDGLVSFWGAPLADQDHADLALDAALAIVRNVASFNARRNDRGLAPVVVRIGLASGEALVGDLGTPFRISYTAVGDCINLASRLQQASRLAGVNILVAGSVVERCTRHVFVPIDTIPIRGLPDQKVFTPDDSSSPQSDASADQAAG